MKNGLDKNELYDVMLKATQTLGLGDYYDAVLSVTDQFLNERRVMLTFREKKILNQLAGQLEATVIKLGIEEEG